MKDYELQLRQFDQEVRASLIETFRMFEIFNRSDQLAAREKIYDYGEEGVPADALKLNDVFIYFDFFDALQICVESNTCDALVAAELFQPYAVDAWAKLEDEVAEYRVAAGKPKFGLGVQWLAAFNPVAAADTSQPEPDPSPAALPAEDARQ